MLYRTAYAHVPLRDRRSSPDVKIKNFHKCSMSPRAKRSIPIIAAGDFRLR